jgi:hypothetical protein
MWGKGDYKMSDFTVIETQEQLDAVIGDRLNRERETAEKKYKDYLSPEDVAKKYEGYLSPEDVEKKYKDYLSPEDAAKKDAQIKGYETDSAKTRIALELGIPYEMAGRLKGDDEKSIREDAKIMAKLIANPKVPPLKSTETVGNSKTAAAYKTLLGNLKGE